MSGPENVPEQDNRDRLLRPPDKVGSMAKAWRSRVRPTRPEHEASIAAWFVQGPFHPFWSWWLISAVSLRDIPGAEPAKKRYPEAEWEIMILSLDPNFYPPSLDAAPQHFLTPPDLVYQFDGIAENQVEEVVELMIEAMINGRISPDQDYRGVWERSLRETVRHYKEGKH